MPQHLMRVSCCEYSFVSSATCKPAHSPTSMPKAGHASMSVSVRAARSETPDPRERAYLERR
eukprot:3076463-Rhodomonas_salina.1